MSLYKCNHYHWQRKSAASSTPLLRGTSGPSAALSSGPACPEPTEDLEERKKEILQNAHSS